MAGPVILGANSEGCQRLGHKLVHLGGYTLPAAVPAHRDKARVRDTAVALPSSIPISSSQHVESESPIVFQFLLGLEGTGHHLHQEFYMGSQAHRRLEKYGLVQNIAQLLRSLWNIREPSNGLWSATCAHSDEEKWWKRENDDTNGEVLFSNLVGHLKSIEKKARIGVEANNTVPGDNDLVIAVNSGSVNETQEIPPFMSYPLREGVSHHFLLVCFMKCCFALFTNGIYFASMSVMSC